MSNLSERLSEFMSEQNLTASELAKIINVHSTNVNQFLRNARMPVFSSFVKMLDCFNCSADYLLGLVDLPPEEPLHSVPPFNERLRSLLKERKITQETLSRELPVSKSVLYKWLSGKNQPTANTLIKLSAYFECSVDYLIGRVR